VVVSNERSFHGAEAEVAAAFADYEAALVANDVERMDLWFADSPDVIRFGLAEVQFGAEAVRDWRRSAVPVPRSRRLTSQRVLALAADVVAVDVTFESDEHAAIGRQSQVWVRRPEGWRILRAHVSLVRGQRNPDATPSGAGPDA
jgi:hypothetical protein